MYYPMYVRLPPSHVLAQAAQVEGVQLRGLWSAADAQEPARGVPAQHRLQKSVCKEERGSWYAVGGLHNLEKSGKGNVTVHHTP